MKIIKTISSKELHNAVDQLSEQLVKKHKKSRNLVIIGIANGGVALSKLIAQKVSSLINREIPSGIINAVFHRDDLGSNPIPKDFFRTQLPVEIDDTEIILIDDVIFTGRTVRATIDEIFDQGRPKSIDFVVLLDRGHRCLPIQPNYTGFTIDTTLDQVVKANINLENPLEDNLTIYQK